MEPIIFDAFNAKETECPRRKTFHFINYNNFELIFSTRNIWRNIYIFPEDILQILLYYRKYFPNKLYYQVLIQWVTWETILTERVLNSYSPQRSFFETISTFLNHRILFKHSQWCQFLCKKLSVSIIMTDPQPNNFCCSLSPFLSCKGGFEHTPKVFLVGWHDCKYSKSSHSADQYRNSYLGQYENLKMVNF